MRTPTSRAAAPSPKRASAHHRGPDDPLRLCVYTTIALLAWGLGAPVVVMAFGGLGLIGYGRAASRGLRRSRCFLGDVRLVIGYLAAAFGLGAFFTIHRVLHALR
jgi:hypothetical protein